MRRSAKVVGVRSFVAVLLIAAWPALARAEGEEPPPPRPSTAAALGAIVPGVLLHGSGHFVAGDRQTAYRLLALEGAGVVLTGVGGATLVATGASRHLSAAIFALPVAGLGLVLVSWLADVQGVTLPSSWRGAPTLTTPWLEARVGSRYVYDPTLAYGTLIGPAFDLRWRRWRLSPGAWFATAGGNQKWMVEGAFRPLGPRPRIEAVDGSYVDVVLGFTRQRFRREDFDLTVLEAGARGRVDLRRLARSLTGSFAEWGVGLGWGLTHYRVGAHETDAAGLLLARFGYGLYFGQAPGRTGEVMAYYDHRHDDYAGGAKLTGRISGAPGHVGLEGTWFFAEHWGVRVEGQAGSAYLAGLSVIHRTTLAGGGS